MPSRGNFIVRHWLACWMCFYIVVFYALIGFLNQTAEFQTSQAQATAAGGQSGIGAIKEQEASFLENIQTRPRLIRGLALLSFGVILAGLGLSIYFAIRISGGRGPFTWASAQGQPRWGISEVLHVFLFLFFIEAVILSFETGIFFLFGVGSFEKDLFLMSNSLFRDLFTAGLVIAIVKGRLGQSLSELGLTTKNFFKNVTAGLLGYITILPGLVVLLVLVSWVTQWFAYEPPPQPVVQIYLKDSSQPYLVWLTVFVAVIGPAIEEIFFRGFTYKAFRSSFGPRRAMIGSALIFAALHMNMAAMVPIFFLGLFLAYLYEKTGSLVPSMTVHMLHNVIMVVLTLGFKSLASG